MELSASLRSRLLLFSLLVLVVPMVIFPRTLGTELLHGSILFALYELVFYGLVIFVFNTHTSLWALMQAAGVCLIFRLILGTMFGILVAAMYAMDISLSIALGISSYVPAMFLHILTTPAILAPVIGQIIPAPKRRRTQRADGEERSTVYGAGGTETPVASLTASTIPSAVESEIGPEPIVRRRPINVQAATGWAVASDSTGFDRATNYVGEDGSVRLAVVVDNEGLLLSTFRRGTVDPEAWAPLALVLRQTNQKVLALAGGGNPDRLDLRTGNDRVVCVHTADFHLLVVSEQHTDDLLGVRINQAVDMIRKYVEERYPGFGQRNPESAYVQRA